MTSDLASIISSESQKPGLGFRDKILALKNPLAASERTDPAFENSFGDQLTDLGGRRRWVLVGLALQQWHQDLRDRVGEVLREHEGEIYKGRSIRGIATVRHCWMLGHDKTCAQPTVVISCSQSTVLKRTFRVVSQHGVLKAAKFALKAIPFCDLRLRMDRRVSFLSGEDYTLDNNGEIQRDGHGYPIRKDLHEQRTIDESRTEEKDQGQEKDIHDNNVKESNGLEKNSKGLTSVKGTLVEAYMEPSDEAYVPLRFGAEEIFVPESGRPTTLGGFIMVDDVCFGLTAAHAFTEENESFTQQSISGSLSELPFYDSDWADGDSSDDDDDEDFGLDQPGAPHQERRLQRKKKSRTIEDQTYYTTAWNSLHIVAKSRLSSAEGLDWALCELGDWGRYAVNGVYLRPELRSAEMPEHLLFRNIKTTPPLGKVLVATRRGAVPGVGTGSDSSIKLGRDNKYRHVWSIEVEESLSSGDSGSWVVDATTGDVYGMIVAGSTLLREEYVIPAAEIAQDICLALRADTVRLPTFQDVMAAHTEERSTGPNLVLTDDSMDWETDDSDEAFGQEPLKTDEERFLLAEVLKHSSISTETLVKVIKAARVRPKWTKIAIPKGRSMKTAQRAMDRLLSSRRIKEEVATEGGKELTQREKQERQPASGDAVSESRVREDSPNYAKTFDDNSAVLVEEPKELLDSNPSFRAETSRRAWRAKRQAERGPKPHHRKSYRKSDEFTQIDPTMEAFDPESTSYESKFDRAATTHGSKFEMDSEDEPSNDEPDIIIVRHKQSLYKLNFPAFSLAEGQTLVGHLRQQAAIVFDVEDASRVTLIFRGKTLKIDSRTCHEEGLRMRSEVLCVVKRTPMEELDFLSHKFRTELVPQGLEFISNIPTDTKKRDFDYKRISETIMSQILLKSDAVETDGDTSARLRRKELVMEVQAFLRDVDAAARRTVPSDWHADFIEQKETPGTRGTSPTLPSRPTLTASRSSRFGKRDSRNDDSKEEEVETSGEEDVTHDESRKARQERLRRERTERRNEGEKGRGFLT